MRLHYLHVDVHDKDWASASSWCPFSSHEYSDKAEKQYYPLYSTRDMMYMNEKGDPTSLTIAFPYHVRPLWGSPAIGWVSVRVWFYTGSMSYLYPTRYNYPDHDPIEAETTKPRSYIAIQGCHGLAIYTYIEYHKSFIMWSWLLSHSWGWGSTTSHTSYTGFEAQLNITTLSLTKTTMSSQNQDQGHALILH